MKHAQSIWLWELITLWRKGTQDEKKPAAYSWENPPLFFPDFDLLQTGEFLFKFWPDKVTLRIVCQKGCFFRGESILQWQEDAVACPTKFIWKGSSAINQSIFSSYHRQKSLFQKQTGAFSLFCTTATVLTGMLKLFSQILNFSAQRKARREASRSLAFSTGKSMFLGITNKSKIKIQLVDSWKVYVGIWLPILQSIFLQEE